MRKLTLSALIGLVLLFAVSQVALSSAARFGYYWKNNTLAYDTEFSYFFDVAVYPGGVFADCEEHSWAYITAQNKHILYDGVPYGVEVVLQYGYGADNIGSIKRVWMNDFDDPSRFTSWWIDSDADGIDFWELSTLDANGYLVTEPDAEGDVLEFLRVQAQTIFVSETSNPIQSTWENRFYFYNFSTNQWNLKVKNSFTIPASRQAVRDATYLTGSGIWAGILETEGDEGGPPDYGKPPVKKIVYKNRWIRVVDQGVTSTPNLDASNNWWIEPQSPYQLFYRSQPIYSGFAAGSEIIIPCPSIFLPMVLKSFKPPQILFVDHFYSDTTPSYQRMGIVVWQASSQNVMLGNATPDENRLYKNLSFDDASIISGRVYVPSTGVGAYDSVAVALKGGGVEYWATLAYGASLTERNNISIIRNDVWGNLYPMSLDPGWYTVKVLVDYDNGNLWMKAWPDGASETGWQVSRSLDAGWIAQGFGFRHYGQGTFVDDLMLIRDKLP